MSLKTLELLLDNAIAISPIISCAGSFLIKGWYMRNKKLNERVKILWKSKNTQYPHNQY